MRRAARQTLATRNALIIWLPPVLASDGEVADATQILAEKAVAAGAPAGVIQVWTATDEPRADLTLGPPVLGPMPVLVDQTGDLAAATAWCSTMGGMLIVTRGVDATRAALRRHAGDRAAIFSADPAAILAYAGALPIRQLLVNGARASEPWDERLVTWVRVEGFTGPAPNAGTRPNAAVPPYPRLGRADVDA